PREGVQEAANHVHIAGYTRPRRRDGEAVAAFPDQVRRDRDDQETVRIVIVVPPVVYELDEHVAVQECEGQDGEPADKQLFSTGRPQESGSYRFYANHL